MVPSIKNKSLFNAGFCVTDYISEIEFFNIFFLNFLSLFARVQCDTCVASQAIPSSASPMCREWQARIYSSNSLKFLKHEIFRRFFKAHFFTPEPFFHDTFYISE